MILRRPLVVLVCALSTLALTTFSFWSWRARLVSSAPAVMRWDRFSLSSRPLFPMSFPPTFGPRSLPGTRWWVRLRRL